jgi:hypothetical protein
MPPRTAVILSILIILILAPIVPVMAGMRLLP